MSLNLEGIEKSFAQGATELKILSGLSLNVTPGERLAIVGKSGSGKSTLLSVVAGFEPPQGGEVKWDGESTRPWGDERWSSFRKQGLGFVFQNYHLIPYLTAEENVALPLRLLKRPEFLAPAREWLTRLGLGQRFHHLPSELSGGERQRVAIARALIHQPRLLLADEPTGSLDVKTGEEVLEILFSVLEQLKQTALVVTHSREVAARCDRVLVLKQGRLWPA